MSEADQSQPGRDEIWLEKYRPQMLDEVVGQDKIVERLKSYVERDDLSHMLFAGPAGVGKCVTGETPVLTDEGLFAIEDIVGDIDGFIENHDETQVLTYDKSGEFDYTEPSHFFSKKAEEVCKVTTRDGSNATVTPEHRLLVLTRQGFEWRNAEDLETGDRIVRPLETPTPEKDNSIDWLNEMDGKRTFVHVSEDFCDTYDIPYEENLVGIKKQIVRKLRRGCSVDEIHREVDTPRKTVTAAKREFDNVDLDAGSTVLSLSHLRDLNLPRETVVSHVEAIQYVTSSNKRSRPISPPWEMTPKLAAFIGLSISEATISTGRIKFYNNDRCLLEQFKTTAEELFNIEPRTGVQKGVPYVEVNSKSLTHYLKSCFDSFSSASGDSGIGSVLIRADRESKRAFLRAVFDAEAHIRENGLIELTQKNKDLITLLTYLLAEFGIPSRRKMKQKQATNGSGISRQYHTLYISSSLHTSQFESEIGFSLEEKSNRLSAATRGSSNPNHDTVPAQEAVTVLCNRLNLDKQAYISPSLNPDSPGRKRYLAGVSELVDDATVRLEEIQKSSEMLSQTRADIDELSCLLPNWTAKRTVLQPTDVRKQLATEMGVSESRLLEYARGDRTPYANRVQNLLTEITDEDHTVPVKQIQNEFLSIINSLDISYATIGDGTSLHSSEISNLLTNSDHEVQSLPRFDTVAQGLQTTLSQMASIETLEAVRTLHRLTESDIYLDTVEEVSRVEEPQRVYDLTVPETHNYIAGQIPTVMHNTTSSIAIARELYGEGWEEHFLELNASDERGIDVVRDRVKSFARTSFGGHSYRIIFLDEADALTSDAQSALRRTMEQFSNNVRFILSCNYSSQIIDPIQSRCAVFRFSPLPDEAIEQQVRQIADNEGIEVTDDGLEALVYVAGGDMRAAINGLQAAAVTGAIVDEEAVFEITSTARPEDIEEMVTLALAGDFTASRSQLDRLLTEEGIAGGDVIDQLHRSVWEFDLEDEAAVRLLDRIGEADYRITEGANERIQLEALLASVALDR